MNFTVSCKLARLHIEFVSEVSCDVDDNVKKSEKKYIDEEKVLFNYESFEKFTTATT